MVQFYCSRNSRIAKFLFYYLTHIIKKAVSFTVPLKQNVTVSAKPCLCKTNIKVVVLSPNQM